MKKQKPRKIVSNPDTLATARISIDYDKNTKIKFSYPTNPKKESSTFFAWMILISISMGIVFIIASITTISIEGYKFMELSDHDINKYINNREYNFCKEGYEKRINQIIENTCYGYTYGNMSYNLFRIGLYKPNWKVDLKEILFHFSPYLIMILIMRIFFYKKLKRKLPKFFSSRSNLYIKTFISEDFKDNKKYLEIPLFKNQQLHYNAVEEFSKYLRKVEVREYDLKVKIKKRKRKIEISDNLLWYARFYFSKIPKTGKMEVEFK
jgi:magnesium-transporting ATPase (P-type)